MAVATAVAVHCGKEEAELHIRERRQRLWQSKAAMRATLASVQGVMEVPVADLILTEAATAALRLAATRRPRMATSLPASSSTRWP